MKVKAADIVEALEGSDKVEVSADKKKVRRTNNQPLPPKPVKDAKAQIKKRDAKANDKEESKEEKKQEVEVKEAEVDAKGNHIMCQLDFENPLIVHFETKDTEGDKDFKVQWKDMEGVLKANFKRIKIAYSRADQFMGELAISSHNVCTEELEKLKNAVLKV